MGILVEGRWTDADDAVIKGRFVRPDSAYGSPLAGICDSLQSEPGRYHLVASLSCPWSQRALIVHGLKDLRGCVPVHIIGGGRTQGYALDDSPDWRLPGSDAQSRHLHELYSVTDRTYSGRATVPVLWDSHASRIVSNESAQIIRAFDAAGAHQDGAFTLVPLAMRDDIDALNTYVQEHLCDAVYRAGFAQRQDACEEESPQRSLSRSYGRAITAGAADQGRSRVDSKRLLDCAAWNGRIRPAALTFIDWLKGQASRNAISS